MQSLAELVGPGAHTPPSLHDMRLSSSVQATTFSPHDTGGGTYATIDGVHEPPVPVADTLT